MGIKDLTLSKRLTIDEILAELADPVRAQFMLALTTRQKGGTSRFFEVSATRIAKACADDGYVTETRDIEEWRRANVD